MIYCVNLTNQSRKLLQFLAPNFQLNQLDPDYIQFQIFPLRSKCNRDNSNQFLLHRKYICTKILGSDFLQQCSLKQSLKWNSKDLWIVYKDWNFLVFTAYSLSISEWQYTCNFLYTWQCFLCSASIFVDLMFMSM